MFQSVLGKKVKSTKSFFSKMACLKEPQSAKGPRGTKASRAPSAKAPKRQSAKAPKRQSAKAPKHPSVQALRLWGFEASEKRQEAPKRARAAKRQSAKAPKRQSAKASKRSGFEALRLWSVRRQRGFAALRLWSFEAWSAKEALQLWGFANLSGPDPPYSGIVVFMIGRLTLRMLHWMSWVGVGWRCGTVTFMLGRLTYRNLHKQMHLQKSVLQTLSIDSGCHAEVGFHFASFKEMASSEFSTSVELQSESKRWAPKWTTCGCTMPRAVKAIWLCRTEVTSSSADVQKRGI